MNKSRKTLACLVFTCTLLLSFAPANPVAVSWDTLQNIPFKDKYIEEVKGYMLFPTFPSNLKSLDGKQVKVEGYIIPFDKTGAKVALSANPYASCFFCGKAGPASVMTVNLKVPNKKYRTDNYKSFTGRLRLNENDIKEFYYILDGAEEVKE